jgi:hypothetical protein
MTGSDTSIAPNICRVKKYIKVRLKITEMTGSDTSRAPNICRVKGYKKVRLEISEMSHQQSPEHLQGQRV